MSNPATYKSVSRSPSNLLEYILSRLLSFKYTLLSNKTNVQVKENLKLEALFQLNEVKYISVLNP